MLKKYLQSCSTSTDKFPTMKHHLISHFRFEMNVYRSFRRILFSLNAFGKLPFWSFFLSWVENYIVLFWLSFDFWDVTHRIHPFIYFEAWKKSRKQWPHLSTAFLSRTLISIFRLLTFYFFPARYRRQAKLTIFKELVVEVLLLIGANILRGQYWKFIFWNETLGKII